MGFGSSNIYFKSNEVKNSSWMELEGLKRTVATLKDAGLSIKTLITDRHKQVGSYVKKELPDTKHYHDIWHVAKGREHNRVQPVCTYSVVNTSPYNTMLYFTNPVLN